MSETRLVEDTLPRMQWESSQPSIEILRIFLQHHSEDGKTANRNAFWSEVVQDNEEMKQEIYNYWYNNQYDFLMKNSRHLRASVSREARERVTNELKETLRERISAVINTKLLDLVMPNGKTVGECTGAECEDLAPRMGGWLMRVGLATGTSNKVKDKLSEEQLRDLYVK